jgi:hypothetical protein
MLDPGIGNRYFHHARTCAIPATHLLPRTAATPRATASYSVAAMTSTACETPSQSDNFSLARHPQSRTRTSCDQRFIRPRKRPRCLSRSWAFWLFGLYASRVRIPFVEQRQLTTGFGVLTIRPHFISEAERSPIYCASNVAVIRGHAR